MAHHPAIDLASMSLKELRNLLLEVDAAIEERKIIDEKALLDELATLAESAGYSLDELFDADPKKRRAK